MKRLSKIIVILTIITVLCVVNSKQINAEEENSNIQIISVTFEDMINGNFEKLLLSNAFPSFAQTVRYDFEKYLRL